VKVLLNCILNGLWNNAVTAVLAASIFAAIAALIVSFGALSVVLGPLGTITVASPILAALVVFAAVMVIIATVIIVNCVLNAQSPSLDEAPVDSDRDPVDLTTPAGSSDALDGGGDNGTQPEEPDIVAAPSPIDGVAGKGKQK